MIARTLVAAASLALLAAPAGAQSSTWSTSEADGEAFAHAVSSNRQLHLGVTCTEGGHG